MACEEWEYPSDFPAYSKDLSIIQLLELVTEHLRSKLGVRKIPLSYFTRVYSTVPTIGRISSTFPYSEGVESFHEELITRASHNHPYNQVHALTNFSNNIAEVQTVFQRLNGFPDFRIFQEELNFPIQSFAQLNSFNR